jgi:hypothetical protein
MGQHRHAISRIYPIYRKNSQSAFLKKPLRAAQNQGLGRAVLRLWDGSEFFYLMLQSFNIHRFTIYGSFPETRLAFDPSLASLTGAAVHHGL